MATVTDDNAEIRNLDARLFKKLTCWYIRISVNVNGKQADTFVGQIDFEV